NARLLKQPGQIFSFRPFFACFSPPDGLNDACAAGGGERTPLILCRACGHELADERDVKYIPGPLSLSDTLIGDRRVHVQVPENPHGRRFEVITFRRAAVTRHLPPDKGSSWFPGYSWMVATCPRFPARLKSHECAPSSGWAFQPSDWPDTMTNTKLGESEHTFLALITHRLLREDFASSLLMVPKSFTR
ncbi:LOW QUALITY PROTEIN: uncharacterized protein si:ch211-51h9.7, partial [Lampris incognitus]|uniref:LOW QUALITY PROTEIN: uncharacterized protein si:ch211-51h9.7 n=1 Tax=Lampris incognitus TaxID=2546036 RepID=UPI0024B4F1E4